MMTRPPAVTEFVMSPFHGDAPETLSRDELLQRAKLLSALAQRLDLFATQKLRPSEELSRRVRDLLRRFPDLSPGSTVRPHNPLGVYFSARFHLFTTARKLRITVD